MLDPADPRSARPLTDEGFDDRRPAISPDGKVVAFVSNRGGRTDDYDVCFVGIDATQAAPRCIADRDRNVSRPAWSPDGRSILVDREPGHPDRARAAHLRRPVVGERRRTGSTRAS